MGIHLVTGGAGFVGSVLTDHLIRQGERVRVLDTQPHPYQLQEVEYVQGSILEPDDIKRAMLGVTYVHHTAAAVPLHHRSKIFNDVNFEGTKRVFFAAKEAGAKHFCQISSSAVYGSVSSSDCPIETTHIAEPFEDYGRSKLKADSFLLEMSKLEGSPAITILRPRTVLGPGRLGLMQLLFEWIRLGCDVFLPGSGENKFQLLDVRDLADASIKASLSGCAGLFLLGTSEFGSLKEDLGNLCRHAGTGSQIKEVHRFFIRGIEMCNWLGISPLNEWHIKAAQNDIFFNTSLAQQKLMWSPKYSNSRMLIDSYEWYLKNRDVKSAQKSIHQRPLNWGVLAITKLGGKWVGTRKI